MIRAYGYLRVSTQYQLEGDGFDRQRATILKYAAANGIEIVQFYEERGVSGVTDIAGRPAWLEMVGAIMADGSVKTIVVEKLDRLARDLMVQEYIIRDLRERRIDPISAMEPDLCIDDPTRKLMRQVMGAFAEYDKTMIVLKTRAARERIRGEKCEGAKAYGELIGEPEILAEIRSKRSCGLTPAAIAADLNDRGVLSRRGKRWHPYALSRILRRAHA